MTLAHPYFLLCIPFVLIVYFIKMKKQTIQYASIDILKRAGMKPTYKHLVADLFISLAFISLFIALARPQTSESILPVRGEGIDIVTVLDVSNSMDSIDIKPNRLTIAKANITSFIEGRYNDRLGLVIFSGTAYTRIPPTLDHHVVTDSLASVSTDSVSEDGTAIGMAISVGINRLKKSESASKVIVLVTDGESNAGDISPETAADLATELDIKIYCIGIGTDTTIIPYESNGQTHYHTIDTGINEPLLTSIAERTNGQYYRATSDDELEEIFTEIDTLEKTEFERTEIKLYEEWAFPFILIGLCLLFVGILFKRYLFIQIP